MARTFNGTTDVATLSLGSGASLSTVVSLAVIFRPTLDFTGTSQLALTVGGTTRHSIGRNSSNNRIVFSGAAGNTATATGSWVLAVGTKPAGTGSAPRIHVYDFMTRVWAHDSGSATVADATPNTQVTFGNRNAANWFKGDVAVGGCWAANLTDNQVETLAFSLIPWYSYSNKGLWVLDQAATGTKIWDLTGGGANESSLTGTSVATAAVPVWNRGARPIVVDFTPGSTSTPVSDNETGSATDAGESIAAAIADSDTATATDAGEAIAVALTDGDMGTAADAGESIATAIADTDTATAADSGETIAATTTDTDTATAVDDMTVTVLLTDVDTGTAVDSETLAAAVTDVDAAVIVEAEAIVAAIVDTDTVTADDLLDLVVAIMDSDAGAATDTLLVTLPAPPALPACITATAVPQLSITAAAAAQLTITATAMPELTITARAAQRATITATAVPQLHITATAEAC